MRFQGIVGRRSGFAGYNKLYIGIMRDLELGFEIRLLGVYFDFLPFFMYSYSCVLGSVIWCLSSALHCWVCRPHSIALSDVVILYIICTWKMVVRHPYRRNE